MRGTDPYIDCLPEGNDDDGDQDFAGAVGGESAQSFVVKRMLQNLEDHCRTLKRKVSTNISEAVELAHDLSRSLYVHVNVVPSSEALIKHRKESSGSIYCHGKSEYEY